MMHQLVFALIGFISISIITAIFQPLGSIFFAIASENLALKFRVQAFRNILNQDGAYFDDPKNVPASLINSLATNASDIKAGMDVRMMYIISGVATLTACSIISLIYVWEIGLAGSGLDVLLALVQIFLARMIQKRNIMLATNDEAGKVSINLELKSKSFFSSYR